MRALMVVVTMLWLSSSLEAASLIWSSFSPGWKSGRFGLCYDMTNRRYAASRNPDLRANFPNVRVFPRTNARQSEIVRLTFDVRPGSVSFGTGILFSNRDSMVRFLLSRDKDVLITEITLWTNNTDFYKKQVLPLSGFELKERGNELLWNRRVGSYSLNGTLLYQSVPIPYVEGRMVSILSADRAVIIRRMRLQSTGRTIDSATQSMVTDTVTLFDEIFNENTRTSWKKMIRNVEEDAGGAGDVMGP